MGGTAQVKTAYTGPHGKFEGFGFLIPFFIHCNVLFKHMATSSSNNPRHISENSEPAVYNLDLQPSKSNVLKKKKKIQCTYFNEPRYLKLFLSTLYSTRLACLSFDVNQMMSWLSSTCGAFLPHPISSLLQAKILSRYPTHGKMLFHLQ